MKRPGGEAERGRRQRRKKADERQEESERGDTVTKTNVGWDGGRSYGRRSYMVTQEPATEAGLNIIFRSFFDPDWSSRCLRLQSRTD